MKGVRATGKVELNDLTGLDEAPNACDANLPSKRPRAQRYGLV